MRGRLKLQHSPELPLPPTRASAMPVYQHQRRWFGHRTQSREDGAARQRDPDEAKNGARTSGSSFCVVRSRILSPGWTDDGCHLHLQRQRLYPCPSAAWRPVKCPTKHLEAVPQRGWSARCGPEAVRSDPGEGGMDTMECNWAKLARRSRPWRDPSLRHHKAVDMAGEKTMHWAWPGPLKTDSRLQDKEGTADGRHRADELAELRSGPMPISCVLLCGLRKGSNSQQGTRARSARCSAMYARRRGATAQSPSPSSSFETWCGLVVANSDADPRCDDWDGKAELRSRRHRHVLDCRTTGRGLHLADLGDEAARCDSQRSECIVLAED